MDRVKKNQILNESNKTENEKCWQQNWSGKNSKKETLLWLNHLNVSFSSILQNLFFVSNLLIHLNFLLRLLLTAEYSTCRSFFFLFICLLFAGGIYWKGWGGTWSSSVTTSIFENFLSEIIHWLINYKFLLNGNVISVFCVDRLNVIPTWLIGF